MGSYSAPSFAYRDNVMTYKYPEMSYKTDTANATGFFNGGFSSYGRFPGNYFGHGQFPVNGNPFGHGQFPVNGNPFGHGQFPVNGNPLGYSQFPVNGNLLPMSYSYEYQYPTEMSYSAPSFAYKDNVMTWKYPEMSYKTETANATGFFNGGFPGYGNLLGSSDFPRYGKPFSYGRYSQSRYHNSRRHGYGPSRFHRYGQLGYLVNGRHQSGY